MPPSVQGGRYQLEHFGLHDIVIFSKIWLNGASLFDWYFSDDGKVEYGFIILIFLDFI